MELKEVASVCVWLGNECSKKKLMADSKKKRLTVKKALEG